MKKQAHRHRMTEDGYRHYLDRRQEMLREIERDEQRLTEKRESLARYDRSRMGEDSRNP